MFLGFVSIGLIINDEPLKAGGLILIAGVFDVFDGKIARILGLESEFGMEFDSMADTISFCVVPSILIYSLYVDNMSQLLGLVISFMPLMFGTIRLAKFNINNQGRTDKSYTEGLTTPISTICLFSYLFFSHTINNNYGDPRIALVLVSFLCMLMISTIPFPKFPILNFRSGKKNSILLSTFIFSLICLLLFKGYILLPISLVYIGWCIIHWLINNDKKKYPTASSKY
jgi:CDP-diacylglycerol--serine O-phosphatidyltransferase